MTSRVLQRGIGNGALGRQHDNRSSRSANRCGKLKQSDGEDHIDGSQAARSLALAGVSVVEAGQGVSAAFAAKLMALPGATVVKVEPPEGDLTRRRGPFPAGIPDPGKR